MTIRPQTFIEHTILAIDAAKGIHYSTFEEFWQKRMEPMQFIAPSAKGPLAHVRDRMIDRAREQWDLFQRSADGCGGLPQAGEACPQDTREPGQSQENEQHTLEAES